MSALLTRMRRDSGQAMIFMVFALLGLVGMTSLVIDGGSWFRTQRQVQTAADAAALAGAQDLPIDSTAQTTANTYAQQNFSGIAAPIVTFPSTAPCAPHSCIDVVAQKPVSGIFLPALNATARAHARAQISVPLSMKNVAPIALQQTQACIVSNPSCFGPGHTVTIDFDYSNIAPGMFGLINVECYSDTSSYCGNGSIGGNDLRDVVENGYPGMLPSQKWYGIKTGNTVGPVRQGLEDAADAHKILLFPIWDVASAANKTFHIIGWAAFVITPNHAGVNWTSQNKKLTGYFTTFIATDVAGGGGAPGGTTDFGVHVVNLTQ
jgi:hypothetical protein